MNIRLFAVAFLVWGSVSTSAIASNISTYVVKWVPAIRSLPCDELRQNFNDSYLNDLDESRTNYEFNVYCTDTNNKFIFDFWIEGRGEADAEYVAQYVAGHNDLTVDGATFHIYRVKDEVLSLHFQPRKITIVDPLTFSPIDERYFSLLFTKHSDYLGFRQKFADIYAADPMNFKDLKSWLSPFAGEVYASRFYDVTLSEVNSLYFSFHNVLILEDDTSYSFYREWWDYQCAEDLTQNCRN
jgi:hypothetical protein